MRRTSLPSLLALVLALSAVLPVAATAPLERETLTGVLEAVHVDELATGVEREEYALRTDHGIVPLWFADGGPEGLGGATVTVTGTRSGKGLVVGSSAGRSILVRSVPPAQALGGDPSTIEALDSAASGSVVGTGALTTAEIQSAAVEKKFAVILINFTDLRTEPWTKATVQAALTGSGGLKAFYEEESKGRLSITGSVFGWFRIDAATTGCDWRTWHTLGVNAATAAGVNFADYNNVIFAWPQTNQCGFAGVAYVPGSYSYLNGTIHVQVMSHEVGHNFGISHANARSCTVNGTRVTLAAGANCTTQTYADPFSTMGNNAARHNHGSQLGELGWLSPSEVVAGTPGNSYTVSPYFAAGGVKLVRVPRGDGTFFDLDYRMTYGTFDNFTAGSPPVSGVTIRIGKGTATPTRTPQGTELLDTTPATMDLRDAPLLVGRTMTDPVSTISFTTESITALGATVRVREAIAPSAPSSLSATATAAPSVALAWGAATDNIAVTGYRISRDGAVVAAADCSTLAWTDTAVTPGATHAYAVAALDGSGNAGPAASASAAVPAPPAPSPSPDPTDPPQPTPTPDPTPAPDPTPTPDPDVLPPTEPAPLSGAPAITTVSLSWGEATDDTGVAGYRIARDGVPVATAAATSWQDTGRAPLTTYTYSVVAVDTAGNTSSPSQVSVRTQADTIRPTTPTRFRKVSRSGIYVTFAWDAARDNVGVVRYRVYRVGSSTPVLVTRRTRVTIATRYGAYYYVRAFDAAGNRSYASRAVRGR